MLTCGHLACGCFDGFLITQTQLSGCDSDRMAQSLKYLLSGFSKNKLTVKQKY